MGRKSTTKTRKDKSKKTEQWANTLLPKLKSLSLKSLTMNEIAQLIGRSKSTVYEYFKTKEEVFEYMVQLQLDKLANYTSIINLEDDNLIEQFENFILFLGAGVSNISYHLLNELQQDFPEIWGNIAVFINAMLNDLKLFYEKGIALQQFKNISPELMIRMDAIFVFQIITDEDFFNTTNISLEQLAKDYLRLRLEGVKN